MRWWRDRGLGFKLALGIALILFVSVGAILFGIARYMDGQLLQREMQTAEDVNAVAAIMLEEAMMTGRKSDIKVALETLGERVGGRIDSIAVYDDQVVLTSFASGFPGGRSIHQESMELAVTDPGCWGCHHLPAEERPAMLMVPLEGEEVMRSVVPLYNEPRCQTCHGTGIEVLGDSIVDIRMDEYRQSITSLVLAISVGGILADLLVAVGLYLLLRSTVLTPLGKMTEMTQAVAGGDLEQQVEVRSGDEVGQIATALNNMTARLRELVGGLEQRVAERTRELEQRSSNLAAASEVGRATASVLEADVLARQVVDLIREEFGLYYVGLFLVDPSGEWAVLRAGTGEAGQSMLARGHRIKVGEGMIGWAVANAEARVALEVAEDARRLATSELPETRSEAALPLRSRGQVVGALTVQDYEAGAFDEDALIVLQTMADQVAVALDNARLFQQAQESLEAERRAYGELSRSAWTEMVRSRQQPGYRYRLHQVVPLQDSLGDGEDSGPSPDESPELKLPVKYRGQVFGTIQARKPAEGGEWTPDEIALMETLAEQLSVALDSARMYEETQQRAAREQLVGSLATRIRQTLDVESVLKTTAQEVRQALGLPEVVIRLAEKPADDSVE